ncbi:hypothetical protein ACJIZ3_000811 [Penstemon smallii]|uniref:Uncharacterized protein n=1 Tax=Penstemon smallii TaxID=265156 RepID=A0ABD3U5C6_9LAMI
MLTKDDDEIVSDVDKPYKLIKKDERLEIDDINNLGQCQLIPELGESNLSVSWKKDETVMLLEKSEFMAPEVLAETAVVEEVGGEIIDDKVEAVVADTTGEKPTFPDSSQMDAKKLHVDKLLGMENEEEFMAVVDDEVEAVVTDVSDSQLFLDSQLNYRGDESMTEIKGTSVVKAESEKPVGIENVEPLIIEEIPITEVKSLITEVNVDVVNAIEEDQVIELCDGMGNVSSDVRYEHAEDKDVIEDPKLDDPVNVAHNREETVVEEEHRSRDFKKETEAGVELESAKDDVSEEFQLADAEAETETGTEMVEDKILREVRETDETRSNSDDSPAVLQDEEDETIIVVETRTQDTEIETETDVAEPGIAYRGKRKRGKLSKTSTNSKTTTKASLTRKTVGEGVCFICLDGGDLFLCDRRGCPKAYHPSCVNRDEEFFKAKGSWNCGWHICSICEKNARYMCYTCTFSLCKSCIKDEVILCVRGNKGFCETCMRFVTLIENIEQGGKDTIVDFDDRSSWEFLFKDYYVEQKSKLSLSSVEIAEAKNPWKGANILSGPSKQEFSEAQTDANDGGSGSDNSIENLETVRAKKRKLRKKLKPLSKKEGLVIADVAVDKATSLSDNSEWASKELLEFVSHMKDGDTSLLSQFDVQALLLEYIKRNKLRDTRRQSQIVCDARLQNLFGKPRVGHFEMLKLLESHFLVRDEQNDDVQGSVVDTENDQLYSDDNADLQNKGRRRKTHRKSASRVPQSNLNDYAAIDMHNISLIFMRRKLIEDLLEDAENFHDKVVGTFVRIRISGSTQKQDLHRLVQVVGTSKAAECYKIGKKTTCTMLEILNLNKTEFISIDSISNQEFTEEECKRLRQSIKCGLINRLTVGEILDKTMEIQVARVNDWLESEVLRLSHLRDRASDLGRRKEYPLECVEKLQLLKTPEERRRRLEEIPDIHSDPKMDPSYESDENDIETENRRDAFMRSIISGYSRRGKGPNSPKSDHSMKDSSRGAANFLSKNVESSRNPSSNRFSIGDIVNENSWNVEGGKDISESKNTAKLNSATRSESISGVTSVTSEASLPVVETSIKINESEKMWHYQDPSGKVQGPFSIVQLRKWNNAGYFPADLKIWKTTETKDKSILLSDALVGKFPKELPSFDSISPATNPLHNSHILAGRTSENADLVHEPHSKLSTEKWAHIDITNLQSSTPTPKQSKATGTGGEGSLPTGAIQPAAVNGVLLSPTAVVPNIPTVTSEPHAAQMHGHMPTDGQPVQPVISQNLQTGTQGWDGGIQSRQTQGYNWATSNVQGSFGTVSNSGTMAVPPPNFWSPTGSQPNMPPPGTPNASWGMGPAPGNITPGFAPSGNMQGLVQGNMNSAAWVPWPTGNSGAPLVQGSGPVNGWVPPTGSSGAPPVQGPVPGNGWVQPTGSSGALPVQGSVPVNGWVPSTGNSVALPVQGSVPVNGWVPSTGNSGNSGPPLVQGSGPVNGWVPSTGNSGVPAFQGPVPGNGWVPPTGNMGAQGNVMNQGWGAARPPGNQSSWGGQQNHGGGGQFSGQRGSWNRRQFNRRDKPCPYNINRRCVKGAQCNYKHI